MLNDALNKQERGDVVLMKTLCRLNYNERMSIKEKYEETYETVFIEQQNILLFLDEISLFNFYLGLEKRFD